MLEPYSRHKRGKRGGGLLYIKFQLDMVRNGILPCAYSMGCTIPIIIKHRQKASHVIIECHHYNTLK